MIIRVSAVFGCEKFGFGLRWDSAGFGVHDLGVSSSNGHHSKLEWFNQFFIMCGNVWKCENWPHSETFIH